MSSNGRDQSQRNPLPSSRFLDLLNYRNRTSPLNVPFGQAMSVQAITQHLTPRTFTDDPTPVEEAMLLHDALWELNRQVEALTLVRATALAEVQLLQQTLAAQRSAFRRIPAELLLHIFSFVVEDPLEPFAPSILCRVSRRWYTLVISTPELWSRVTFELPSARSKGGRHPQTFAAARAHLSRSHPLPVSAYIAFQNQRPHADDASAALSILSTYFGRCAKLLIYYETLEPMYATLNALTRFPQATILESLSLTVGYRKPERLEYVAPNRSSEPLVFFSGHAPRLRHVELNGIALPWRGPSGLLTGLEELRLAKHTKEDRPSLGEFLELLSASPGLERLFMSRSGPRWGEGQYAVAQLPHLTDLSFQDVPPEVLQCMLPHMGIPGLANLQMSFWDYRQHTFWDSSAVLDCFSRTKGGSLRTLRLEKTVFETEALLSFLSEKGRELRELSLIATNAEDQLLDCLTPSGDLATWICPLLTSVTLERCECISDRGLRAFWRRRKEGGALRRLHVLDCAGINQTYG